MTEPYLDLALQRLADMQKTAYPGSDAVPDFVYSQESTPFWVNKVNNFDVQPESEALDVITYNITMTLALAIITEGWEGQAEDKTRVYVPTIIKYFNQRRAMKRTQNDSPIQYLYPRGIRVTGGQVDYELRVSGIGVMLFGINYNLELPMYQESEQVTF